ncbi:MAG: hypothetical protein ACTSQG_03990, partial [Promethearchaeota archaeon]
MALQTILSIENVILCRIDVEIVENELDIQDFFNKIDFKVFKDIKNISLENINDDDYLIFLTAKDIEFNEEKIQQIGPQYFIEIKKKRIRFAGPPMFANINYKKILESIGIEGNNLLINLFRYYKEKFKLIFKSALYFEINNKEIIKKVKRFFNNVNSNCQSINTLNARIDGLSLELYKDGKLFMLNINEEKKKIQECEIITIGLDIEESKEITFFDLDI